MNTSGGLSRSRKLFENVATNRNAPFLSFVNVMLLSAQSADVTLSAVIEGIALSIDAKADLALLITSSLIVISLTASNRSLRLSLASSFPSTLEIARLIRLTAWDFCSVVNCTLFPRNPPGCMAVMARPTCAVVKLPLLSSASRNFQSDGISVSGTTAKSLGLNSTPPSVLVALSDVSDSSSRWDDPSTIRTVIGSISSDGNTTALHKSDMPFETIGCGKPWTITQASV